MWTTCGPRVGPLRGMFGDGRHLGCGVSRSSSRRGTRSGPRRRRFTKVSGRWADSRNGASAHRAAGSPGRQHGESATGGVRADSVGVKLPRRAIAKGGAGPSHCDPRPWPVKPRLVCLERGGSPGSNEQSPQGLGACKSRTRATESGASGVQTVLRWCSRIVTIAEVDRRRLARFIHRRIARGDWV